jgi:multiple sugar transport system permease protein
MYEAAAIDGIKNRWQELWFITLPSMKPQLMFGAVMQIAASFGVSSICMELAGFPSTNYSARTVVTHIYDYGTVRYEMGYASAIATVLFLVMILTRNVISKMLKTD